MKTGGLGPPLSPKWVHGKALVGAQGAKPLEAPGFYNIWMTKNSHLLHSMITSGTPRTFHRKNSVSLWKAQSVPDECDKILWFQYIWTKVTEFRDKLKLPGILPICCLFIYFLNIIHKLHCFNETFGLLTWTNGKVRKP